VRRARAARGPQARERRVEELGRVALEGRADLGLLGLAELRQAPEQAVELRFADHAPAGLELLDDGREAAVVEVAYEPDRLLLDDRLRRRQLPAAAGAVGVAGGTAKSSTTSGRPRRAGSTCAKSSSGTTGSAAPVVLTTRSAPTSSPTSSENRPGLTPSRAASSTARPAVRLTKVIGSCFVDVIPAA